MFTRNVTFDVNGFCFLFPRRYTSHNPRHWILERVHTITIVAKFRYCLDFFFFKVKALCLIRVHIFFLLQFLLQNEQFHLENPKGLISSSKSKEDRQYNDQKKKVKRTNNDLQNITQKAKDLATRTPLKVIKSADIWPIQDTSLHSNGSKPKTRQTLSEKERVLRILRNTEVWKTGMYSSEVCTHQRYVLISGMYSSEVCTHQWYVLISGMYSSVVCTHQTSDEYIPLMSTYL
jgi:hypothetical protein